MANKGNTVSQGENDNSSVTKVTVMEDYGLTDRECKRAIMKKLSELQ